MLTETHDLEWNGLLDGVSLPAGIYFLEIEGLAQRPARVVVIR